MLTCNLFLSSANKTGFVNGLSLPEMAAITATSHGPEDYLVPANRKTLIICSS
jgi:hypothetical protein